MSVSVANDEFCPEAGPRLIDSRGNIAASNGAYEYSTRVAQSRKEAEDGLTVIV